MKRLLLLLLLSGFFLHSKAYDTLTVRQVFNFNPGDTFDYKTTASATDPYGIQHTSTSYQRFVITGKIFSSDSQTVTYTRLCLYPNVHTDSLIYNNIDSSIIGFDTVGFQFFSNGYQFQTGIDSNGYIINYSNCATTDHSIEKTYTQGLGLTIEGFGYGNPVDGFFGYDTSLIYYAKGDSTGGTPYYNQSTGINLIGSIYDLDMFPDPVNSILHISLNELQPGYSLVLTDLSGKQILRQAISGHLTSLNISNLPCGVYICHLFCGNTFIGTEKIVKQ